METELARGSHIIFINDLHPQDDAEFKLFPPHCTEGSADTEIIPELAGINGEIICKTRHSAFFQTKLEERLKEIKPGKLIICGVCTDICVYFTAADAWNRDYIVEVPVNCVASFHEKAHEFALKHMEKILAVKLTSI